MTIEKIFLVFLFHLGKATIEFWLSKEQNDNIENNLIKRHNDFNTWMTFFFSKRQNQFNIFLENRSQLRVLIANFGELGVRNCYETKILDECEPVIKRQSA